MPELTAEERRRNVERVRDGAARLREVEVKLAHALAILPGMVREVREIREMTEDALSGAPVKVEGGTEG